jgi:peptidoglycan LD-endopeptidase CwlK
MDAISEQRLAKVLPKLADMIRLLTLKIQQAGYGIRVTQGLRTWEEQDALYQQGRTTPGKIVTNAPPGHSYHNFGLAVDLVPIGDMGPDWDVQHPVWKMLVDEGRALGLTAGALWRTFPDEPHFQLTGNFPPSPNGSVITAYQAGGVEGVWKAAGLVQTSGAPDVTGDISV